MISEPEIWFREEKGTLVSILQRFLSYHAEFGRPLSSALNETIANVVARVSALRFDLAHIEYVQSDVSSGHGQAWENSGLDHGSWRDSRLEKLWDEAFLKDEEFQDAYAEWMKNNLKQLEETRMEIEDLGKRLFGEGGGEPPFLRSQPRF